MEHKIATVTQDAFFDATAAQDLDFAQHFIAVSVAPVAVMGTSFKSTQTRQDFAFEQQLASKCSFIYKINLPECALEKIFLVG